MRTSADIAQELRDGLCAVFAKRLRTVQRPDGKWIVTVPQPTLEGGDVSLFLDVVDERVLLHDNGRTSLFLQTMGIDPRAGRTRAQAEQLATERGCEYRLGRLQALVGRSSDMTSVALGLVDTIKTVSDVGLEPRGRLARERVLAGQVRERLLMWYEPRAIRAPVRVSGEVSEHVVEFAVARGNAWCAVKPVEGRELMAVAANWLATWRDIWLGHSSRGNGNGLAGAVSVYPTAGRLPAEVDVVRDILGRMGAESRAVPAENLQGFRNAVDAVLQTPMLS